MRDLKLLCWSFQIPVVTQQLLGLLMSAKCRVGCVLLWLCADDKKEVGWRTKSKEIFNFQKAQRAKFVSWNGCCKVALQVRLPAVHHRQLRPPDPAQFISYLHVHHLYRARKGNTRALCSSSGLTFWTHDMSSAALMLQTDKEEEKLVRWT